MIRYLLSLGLALYGWSAFASLTGDVNGDGAVNVADLFRARKIADGGLAFESGADVDGDAAVTEVDTWLIQEAVLGRAIPELVDSASIGPSGGILSDGDVSVSFPAGNTGTHHLALLRCADTALDDQTPLHAVYMVCGLSTNLAGFSVSYANCSNDTGLVVGSYLQPYGAEEFGWNWHVLPGNSLTRNSTSVSYSLVSPKTSDMAVTHSLKFATVTAEPPPPVTAMAASADVVSTSVPGHRYAGYIYTGWISPKFHVYTRHWGTVSYDDLENVCGYLYDVVGEITNIFQNAALDSILPKTVYVVENLKVNGKDAAGSFNSFTGTIEVNKNALSNAKELKATVGHELVHSVLGLYSHGDSLAFESMEDGITSWFEAIASASPKSAVPTLYSQRKALPLKSLFRRKSGGFFGSDFAPHQDQGYANSAFIFYHFEDHRSWIKELADKVNGGSHMAGALDALFKEKYGPFDGLWSQYHKFARDYLMLNTNSYSYYECYFPTQIFTADQSGADFSEMYKKIAIKAQLTNLWEEQTVSLKVKEYGAGVLQWEIFKPERIFAPHTKLRVKAHDGKGIDLMMHYKPPAGQKVKAELVEGGLVEEGDGGYWSSVITLATNVFSNERVGTLVLTALVIADNEGAADDYNEVQDFTLSYQFEGDYFMPMQEDFVSFTELSSAHTYYDNQIYADAIFRIVDPSNTAGLDQFTVHRDAIGHSDPAQNYKLHTAFSVPGASRRTPDAFQIRLFSDVTVPALPPFSINISTTGYYAWTHDGQTPVMAADGSPQMELMVYYYPPSAINQVVPGEPVYRAQHIVTSVNNLKQSADGQSGGVLVDVPAQIADYSCVIYVFASEAGESLGPMAFAMVIFPMPEGGQ